MNWIYVVIGIVGGIIIFLSRQEDKKEKEEKARNRLKSKFGQGTPLLLIDKDGKEMGISIFRVDLNSQTFILGDATHQFQGWQWFEKYPSCFNLCLNDEDEEGETISIPAVDIRQDYIDFSNYLEKTKLGYTKDSQQFKDYISKIPFLNRTYEMFLFLEEEKHEVKFSLKRIQIDKKVIECTGCYYVDGALLYATKDKIAYSLKYDSSQAILSLVSFKKEKEGTDSDTNVEIIDTWFQLHFNTTSSKNNEEYESFFSTKPFFKKRSKSIQVVDNTTISFENFQLHEQSLNMGGQEIPFCDWRYVPARQAFYFLLPINKTIMYHVDGYFQIGEGEKYYTEGNELFLTRLHFLEKNLPFLNGETIKMQCLETSEIANWQINQEKVYKNDTLLGEYQWKMFSYSRENFTSVLLMEMNDDNGLRISQTLSELIIKVDYLGTWKRIMN